MCRSRRRHNDGRLWHHEICRRGKFYLGREELKDGNVLEIEFKTE